MTLSEVSRTIVSLASLLPVNVRANLGYGCGLIWGLFPTRDHHLCRLQQRAFLGTSSLLKTAQVFASVGCSTFETINLLPLISAHEHLIECPDWAAIKQVADSSDGVVALTGHVGNWDLLAAYMVARGIPLCVVGREARNRHIQPVLEEIRQKYGVSMIWRADRQGVRTIHKTLKTGGIVGALIDQDTIVKSISVPFFGRYARTPSTLTELGLRLKTRFVSIFMVRIGMTRYRIYFREITNLESVTSVLTAYHAHLEEIIRLFPSQWVWFHKRWRSTENGTRLSSRAYTEVLKSLVNQH
jgi:KDO2-lipid IV(A) lauroyltransferase